jgi:N-hydroxyarylamine O-acetyltransferase
MALKVTIDGASWLADVGFGGCVLTTPLRMDVEEPQATGHEDFRIVAYGPNLMVQARRNEAWLPLYELSQETQYEADYELSNWYTATHPASHFRRSLIAARTTPDARYSLRGNDFAIRRLDGGVERRTLDADEIERVLRDVFRLPVEPDWRPIIEKAAAYDATQQRVSAS